MQRAAYFFNLSMSRFIDNESSSDTIIVQYIMIVLLCPFFPECVTHLSTQMPLQGFYNVGSRPMSKLT
jgi:hypothetical protein